MKNLISLLLLLEAYNSLKEWMEFREKYGEKINENSFVMRDMWRTIDERKGKNLGQANHPLKIREQGIYKIIERALYTQKIRKNKNQSIKESENLRQDSGNVISTDTRMHEFKALHGFRKFFKTICEQSRMKSINIELLMGHKIGVSSSYYKPTEEELLGDYLNAIDYLTINEENKLKQKNQELENKLNDREKIIKEQLLEKEKRLKNIEQKYENDVKNIKKEMEDKFQLILSKIEFKKLV